jgi:ribosomal protein S4
MIYPGYLLNPGDMFQVDPERVLFATGARKDQSGVMELRAKRYRDRERDMQEENQSSSDPADPEATEDGIPSNPKNLLKSLLARAKALLVDPREVLRAKRKQELRDFSQTVKATMSRLGRGSDPEAEVSDLDAQLQQIIGKISSPSKSNPPRSPTTNPSTSAQDPAAAEIEEEMSLSASESKVLAETLAKLRANPPDPTKPYLTPWQPRDFMSAFAFIPRYLEVNQNICSAVYIRHPVARPGLAEVPTPFHQDTSNLAFTWYLRRR